MALTGSNNEQKIWNYLIAKGMNAYGVAGLMGNLYAESALEPKNLQNTYEKSLGYTDSSYTTAVDNGSYKNFVKDSAGYGLAQWTYWSRKENMLNFARAAGKSIGDLEMQLDFLYKELSESYSGVLSTLKSATSVKAASDVVLTKFECPADQSSSAKTKRANYGQTYYDKYASTSNDSQSNSTISSSNSSGKCYASAVIDIAVAEIGYHEKATNASLDSKTANSGSGNYTKYANYFDKECTNWYNGKKNGYAWCDMFVDYCFHMAYGHENALRLLCQPEKSAGAGCTYSLGYFKAKGRFYTSNPKAGDQIFFGTSVSNSTHTGLVEKVDSTYVYTIEGNTSDCVARRKYYLTNSTIVGYGRPAYDSENGSTGSSNTGSAATSSSGDIRYTVVLGDTLSKIASRYSTTYQTLAAYNGISNPNVIRVGQVIMIPSGNASAAVTTSNPTTSVTSSRTHKVVKGDTLSAIAKKYGTTVAKIVSANKTKYATITANYIVVGWTLTIPQ